VGGVDGRGRHIRWFGIVIIDEDRNVGIETTQARKVGFQDGLDTPPFFMDQFARFAEAKVRCPQPLRLQAHPHLLSPTLQIPHPTHHQDNEHQPLDLSYSGRILSLPLFVMKIFLRKNFGKSLRRTTAKTKNATPVANVIKMVV